MNLKKSKFSFDPVLTWHDAASGLVQEYIFLSTYTWFRQRENLIIYYCLVGYLMKVILLKSFNLLKFIFCCSLYWSVLGQKQNKKKIAQNKVTNIANNHFVPFPFHLFTFEPNMIEVSTITENYYNLSNSIEIRLLCFIQMLLHFFIHINCTWQFSS